MYTVFHSRLVQTNYIIYNNWLNYLIQKRICQQCGNSQSLLSLVNKIRISSGFGITNFFPIGLSLIDRNVYSQETFDPKLFRDIIDDLTYFLLQLNDR